MSGRLLLINDTGPAEPEDTGAPGVDIPWLLTLDLSGQSSPMPAPLQVRDEDGGLAAPLGFATLSPEGRWLTGVSIAPCHAPDRAEIHAIDLHSDVYVSYVLFEGQARQALYFPTLSEDGSRLAFLETPDLFYPRRYQSRGMVHTFRADQPAQTPGTAPPLPGPWRQFGLPIKARVEPCAWNKDGTALRHTDQKGRLVESRIDERSHHHFIDRAGPILATGGGGRLAYARGGRLTVHGAVTQAQAQPRHEARTHQLSGEITALAWGKSGDYGWDTLFAAVSDGFYTTTILSLPAPGETTESAADPSKIGECGPTFFLAWTPPVPTNG